MADEGGIFEGVDWSKYDPRNWTLDDVAGTAAELGLTAVAPFFTTLLSPSEAGAAGEDEAVAERHARWDAASPAEKEKILQEREKAWNAENLRRKSLPTEKPFISVSRTNAPRSQASSMPTREDIISRLLASGRGPNITQGGGSPQTATQTVPSPINKRRAATLKREQQSMPKIVTEDIANPAKKLREKEKARKTRKAVGTMLKERQTAPSKADIRSGEKAETRRKIAAAKKKRYQPSTASEIAKTKGTRKAVGTLLKDRQTKPSGEDIRVAREAEAKRKAAKLKRQAALEATASPERPSRKVTKVKPKVVKKVAKKKPQKFGKSAMLSGGEPRSIKEARKMGKSYFINKAGKKLAAVTKEDLEKFRKKTGNPKATLTQLLNDRRDKERSVRKTGGIVKKAGGGKMKQVGLHTAEMRSGGKDLHQPQSKIKKRIHEETTYAKKGGQVGKKKKKKVGKKEQGYKARKDESIAMRVKKKRTKKQLKASRNESYGKWGKGKGKGKINRFGDSLVASTYD